MTRLNAVQVSGFRNVSETKLAARAARAALAVMACSRLGVEIAAVSTAEIAGLNLRFRGVSGPTDVLSFAVPLSSPGGGLMGEIYICPQWVRPKSGRARARGRRLAELVAHGVLHLLGYHHSDAEAEARMFAVQRAISWKTEAA